MTLREIFFSLGYKVDPKSEAQAEFSLKSLKSTATKLLGAIGIGFSLTQLNAIAEEFNGINDSINYAFKGLGDTDAIQKKILATANDTKTSYANMAGIVNQLSETDKDLFPVDDAIKFGALTQKLLIASGKSETEASSLQTTISRVFQTGKVTSGVLRNLYTNAPAFISTLSNSLGVARDKLYDLADAGELTGTTIKEAILKSADTIDADFAGLDFSIGDALLNIRNRWGFFVDDLNSTYGITQKIAVGMVKGFSKFMDVLTRVKTRLEWLSDKLGGTKNLITLLSIVAGALFVAFKWNKIVGGAKKALDAFKAIGTFLKVSGGKLLLIAAIIILIALIVQDFIAFLKGDNSLIGTLFDKSGIGAENARKAIFKAWNAIKNFLIKAWSTIKETAATVAEALRAFWAEHGEQIKTIFKTLWEAVVAVCKVAWAIISTVAKVIFEALKAFWDAWGSTIIKVFQIIWNTLASLLQPFLDALQALLSFVRDVFSGNFEAAFQDLLNFLSAIWQAIVAVFRGAWEIIQTIWAPIGQFFMNLFQAIRDAVVSKVTEIKNGIVEGFTAAIDWIKALPAQALQWGADIINGIVNGIKSTVGKVGDAVKGVADKIKSFLHFSTPDEGPLKDYESWMPDMMSGLAQGISRAKGKVASAVRAAAGDLKVAATANLVRPSTASLAGGGNGGTRSITQNNYFTNQFNGDRAGQEKSSEAMDKASGDATSEMARAIAFAK